MSIVLQEKGSSTIELNHATDLQKNLSQVRFEHVEKRVINGKFEDNIRNLLINKKGQNVFLSIDPYGIRALDLQLFEEFQGYGFKTFEMLINFNSFGFLRNACSVMNVDVSRDEALLDLSDLVEYDPTIVTPSSQSEKLLNSVAGGNYWKDIVNDFQKNKIDGYEAEKTFSNEYKKQLKRKYKYVLDMPIRLQPEQRPKYRMIHVCDHEDGCFLMASNMQKRKDELFINIQQGGQLSLFDCSTSVASTIEGEVITDKQIENMVQARIKSLVYDTHLKVFLADFCNEYGIVCPFRMIYKSLEKIEESGEIQIIRDPALTSTGKKRSFWEENKQQKVIIRRRRL